MDLRNPGLIPHALAVLSAQDEREQENQSEEDHDDRTSRRRQVKGRDQAGGRGENPQQDGYGEHLLERMRQLIRRGSGQHDQGQNEQFTHGFQEDNDRQAHQERQ